MCFCHRHPHVAPSLHPGPSPRVGSVAHWKSFASHLNTSPLGAIGMSQVQVWGPCTPSCGPLQSSWLGSAEASDPRRGPACPLSCLQQEPWPSCLPQGSCVAGPLPAGGKRPWLPDPGPRGAGPALCTQLRRFRQTGRREQRAGWGHTGRWLGGSSPGISAPGAVRKPGGPGSGPAPCWVGSAQESPGHGPAPRAPSCGLCSRGDTPRGRGRLPQPPQQAAAAQQAVDPDVSGMEKGPAPGVEDSPLPPPLGGVMGRNWDEGGGGWSPQVEDRGAPGARWEGAAWWSGAELQGVRPPGPRR